MLRQFPTDTTCFFLEFLTLSQKTVFVVGIADTNRCLVVIALADTFHEELFDSYALFKFNICSNIGIPKAA